MYVDYTFYSTTYGGKVSSGDFIKLEIQASALIDYYTFNRIETVDNKVKYAVCELVDCLKNLEDTGGKEIASESVGGYSVSYDIGNATIAKKQKSIIAKYLGHTGLMYRGRYNED